MPATPLTDEEEAAKVLRKKLAKAERAKKRALKTRESAEKMGRKTAPPPAEGRHPLIESNGKMRSADPKQIRARARRATTVAVEELTLLYGKPMSEWDEEELAKGRPKDKNGNFTGKTPEWVSREVHEESMARFKALIQENMRLASVPAIKLVEKMILDESVDNRGRLVIPPSVKVDAAKWLVEHLVGKPTQPIKTDLSVKLQAVLGAAVVFADPATDSHAPATPSALLSLTGEDGIYDGEVVDDD